ncbi:serine/threonine-protein kinase pim-1-like isoform X2 [Silurus meridionalis]|uniref:serine/threonine-protein kinase pim-1-like isoform X2 n=1 Tax=Silurus meridionalis TaxID=175797 RepID=UPI001EEC2CD0|nr:serine/threonine-protein kinase pim-1-like isoform X2 [Silurus meridionalis]
MRAMENSSCTDYAMCEAEKAIDELNTRLVLPGNYSEASYSFTQSQSEGNPRKRKTDITGSPEDQTEGTPSNRSSTEMDESKTQPFKRKIDHFRTAKFNGRYKVENLLGRGCYGRVYNAVRKTDGKKPGHRCRLPREAALLELVCKPPRCPYVIELLEWFELDSFIILVLKRPDPCINLYNFRQNLVGGLTEEQVQMIMKQTVEVALHCRERGVFHRDIKEENILVNPDTLHVKLIDFGCADLYKETPYTEFAGTPLYIPPEWTSNGTYMAESGTVWGLGILMYSLLCGTRPDYIPEDYSDLNIPDYLSENSRNLLMWCLKKKPEERPTLQQILAHKWF